MSSIPGAHASLGFGRKQIEFYAAPGVTSGEGARRGEHEIRDADGQAQAFRLSRPDTPLEPGETVTVLRAQSGPEHGSRPVAVINHDRNAWTRTMPEATSVLSRSGITRALNWWLAMIAFLLAALVFAWPDLRLFMLEVDPALFASLPDINVFAVVLGQLPSLSGFDLAAAIPGFSGLVEQAGLTGFLSASTLAFVVLLAPLALLTYASRSWRVVLVPVYAFAGLIAGLALNTAAPVAPALMALGGVALLFAVGGFINRTRDSARFEGRVARLSENILRHPPAESVSAPAATALAATSAAAVASELDAPVEQDAEPAAESDTADLEAEDTAEPLDDLPSDEALLAAQAETGVDDDVAQSETLQNASPGADVIEDSAADRDMILPPPPPMANRAPNEGGESGEVRAPRQTPEAVVGRAPEDPAANHLEAEDNLPEAAEAEPANDAPDAGDAGDIGAAPEISPDAVIPAAEPELAEAPEAAEPSDNGEAQATPDSAAASDEEADPFLTPDDTSPRPDGDTR